MLGLDLLVFLVLAQGHAQGQGAYVELAQAALLNPVSHDEISDAVRSAEGVAGIRELFEHSIDHSLSVDATPVAPELGGESILEAGRIVWINYPDPLHPVVRESVVRKHDPAELLAFLESSEGGRWLLKNTGGVHALLYQMTTTTPTGAQRELLDTIVGRMVAEHFKTWSTDAVIQARMIEQTEWRGRYVGFWHIHPPRLRVAASMEVLEGIEPSMGDMENAVQLGQFLTIVFQPSGFDVYDLSPLARLGRVDLSRVEVIRYRSEQWRQHFDQKLVGQRDP